MIKTLFIFCSNYFKYLLIYSCKFNYNKYVIEVTKKMLGKQKITQHNKKLNRTLLSCISPNKLIFEPKLILDVYSFLDTFLHRKLKLVCYRSQLLWTTMSNLFTSNVYHHQACMAFFNFSNATCNNQDINPLDNVTTCNIIRCYYMLYGNGN